MQSTREIFNNHQGNRLHKWNHYFEIYDRHFGTYVNQSPVILEIGVSQGGSIDMWQKFFGPGLKYYGIDINPGCKQFEKENVNIFIGSQSDRKFLNEVKQQIPDLDILIDDGGHTMEQQIITFEEMFSKIKYGGIYLCEDNHTSYWPDFGGGLKRNSTYIEFIKNLIDVMHLWYAGKNNSIQHKELKDKLYSISFYDSIVVIEKEKIEPPFDIKKGDINVGYPEDEKPSFCFHLKKWYQKIRIRLKYG